MKKVLILMYLSLISLSITAQKADLIIFSFDRPLQLYAFLESTERYIQNLGEIHIIYRSSSERYDAAYHEVFQRFSNVVTIKQGSNPHADFKPSLLRSCFESPHSYVVFAVDDIVVQDHIDIAQCIAAMKKNDAYGFYLRLGKNISYCYTMNRANLVPSLHEVDKGIYSWTFGEASGEWNYPNTVDMTIYAKKDINGALRALNYYAPNTCEAFWANMAWQVAHKKGLCYEYSKMVNLPLNSVQIEWGSINRHENFATAQELLEFFERGLKIDIDPLHTIHSQAPHMAYVPSFVERK